MATLGNNRDDRLRRLTVRQERQADKRAGRHDVDTARLQPLPRWVTAAKPVAVLPEAAFISGAGVFAIDQMVHANLAWLGALRMRLALRAAASAARMLRLNADEAQLRDCEHLTRAGDDPGPAGRIHRLLRRLSAQQLRQAKGTLDALQADLGSAGAGPEIMALVQADITLADRLGWQHALPLHLAVILDPALRQGEAGKRPRADETDWSSYHHMVLSRATIAAHATAMELQRKASALSEAAAGLRTRGGSFGVHLVLADDAVAPWKMIDGSDHPAGGLSQGLGSDRAARRFCETLAGQGVLQRLTPRPTFRLYGL